MVRARKVGDFLRPLVAAEVGLVDLLPWVYLHAIVVSVNERRVVDFIIRTHWQLCGILGTSTHVGLVLLSALMHLYAFGMTFSIW